MNAPDADATNPHADTSQPSVHQPDPGRRRMSLMISDVVPQSVHVHNYLHLVGVVILYFDYLLTIDEEYWRIWRPRKTLRTTWLFYLNRYLPLVADIAVNFGNFYGYWNEHFPLCSAPDGQNADHAAHRYSCRQYAFFRQVLLIANQVVVCLCLFLRTFALYGRNWHVGGAVLGFAGILFGVSCWSVVGQHEDVQLKGGCHLAADRLTAIRIAVAWESLFLFDLMRHGLRQPANTLTFYFAEPLLRGCLSTAASSISVTMMSRLMLNLQASASPHPSAMTATSSGGPPTPGRPSADTALIFSTRLSSRSRTPGPGWDDDGAGHENRDGTGDDDDDVRARNDGCRQLRNEVAGSESDIEVEARRPAPGKRIAEDWG
ncbi:uncharacterized protein BXZ73DRAFT_98418 [Epithele typhae]|uniref:uncharacterized protein n=1 Tax=Epithele typhae TaxID=378194 RepID=UPI0020076DCA|nr:uncharacterized protein BXZ73DRAFT_98418 [Epithele typhae]KAH9941203.1 hypothetical protein BXZ73DRAFT_98418 [Epithele typhae]